MNFKNFLKSYFTLPPLHSGVFKVWSRNYLYFRKTWLVSFFWMVIEPMIYLGAIGFGLGSFINNINGESYVDFFFPALLCNTAMLVSFFESTYGSYPKLTYQKTYATIMLTRIGPSEIVIGEILWSASKGVLSVLGVVILSTFLGLVDTPKLLLTLPILFVLSLLFACFGICMSAVARGYDFFIYVTSGLVVPMSLVSGTYFPIEHLPSGLKQITYILPLTHAVSLVRSIVSGTVGWMSLLHVVILVLLTLALLNIAVRKIHNKLLK